MKVLSLTWLLAKPTQNRKGEALLTVGAYTVVSALILTVLAGALSFDSMDHEYRSTYLMLAGLSVVLLVVPLAVLGAAAARLSARSQDTRLSTVRLLGGTPGLVLAMTTVRSAITALVGALGGVVAYAALAPVVGLIKFQGQPIGSAIWLAPTHIAYVVCAVVLVAAVSAAVGLKRIIISPLSVRTRQVTPKPHWIRVLIVAVILAVIYTAFSLMGSIRSVAMILTIVLAGFAAGIWVINLVGPWVISKIGRSKLKTAVTPSELLAARMVLDNPAQTWRQVSGVAMTSFVAVVGGSGAALMSRAGADSTPGSPDQLFAADVMTGVMITIVISFLTVACATAITQAASNLDRQDLFFGLGRLGIEPGTVNQARSQSVMIPVVWVSVGAIIISGVLTFPLAGMAVIIAPLSVGIILTTLVAGILLVRAAVSLTPIRVTTAG